MIRLSGYDDRRWSIVKLSEGTMKIQRTLLALAQGLLLFLASAAHVRADDEADVRA